MPNKTLGEWRRKIEITLSKAKAGDIEAVYAIEKNQFPNPWKKHFFIAELTHDISRFYVARDRGSGKITGYIIFWVIAETIELHNIAVHGDFKRRGIGANMIDFLLATAAEKNIEEVFLEVRKSNVVAIKFYEKFKFKEINCRENYFNNPVEDALVFALYL